ncbi:MAG: hypothetical protein WCG52_06730 [bacterium]
MKITASTKTMDCLKSKVIESFDDAKSQVGKYPTNDGPFLKSPCLVKEFKRILGDDYDDYVNRFLSTCATYQIKSKGNAVYVEKSEAHVGVFGMSFILLDLKTNRMQLVWLRSGWEEHDTRTYGDMPLTDEAKNMILETYKESWGHVVEASFDKDLLRLEKAKELNK